MQLVHVGLLRSAYNIPTGVARILEMGGGGARIIRACAKILEPEVTPTN